MPRSSPRDRVPFLVALSRPRLRANVKGLALYSVVHLAILYEIRTGCSQAVGGTVQSCTHRLLLHRSTRRSASARSLNV